MAYSEHLADRTRAALVASRDLEERRMFGGLAFMVNGHMCCGIVGEELMVRVGPDLYQSSLAQPHTREMDFTGKTLQGMVYVGSEGIGDRAPTRTMGAAGSRLRFHPAHEVISQSLFARSVSVSLDDRRVHETRGRRLTYTEASSTTKGGIVMKNLLGVALVSLVVIATVSPTRADTLTAQQVFDHLKDLEGTWEGEPEGSGEEAKAEAEAAGTVTHEIQISAAGTVVMETMGPDTDHEMINMYHLDGEDLVLTHYCAGGNQPQMRLNMSESTADQLVFDFAGGTNLDPQVDNHIHSARIELVDGDHMESVWKAYSGGEEVATMTFHLARTD